MRVSAFLMILGLGGVLGGAAMIGHAALGLAIIGDSLAVGAYGLFRDVPGDQTGLEHERIREARRQAA